jgi:chromate reductase
MDRYQIAVIVGSLRKESRNHLFANALIRLAPTNLTSTL